VGKEATVVFLGFSQGVAMAYRAAVLGERRAGALIAIGGDVPPDVKEGSADRFPPILIAAGESDEWYTAAKLEADEVFLRARGLRYEIFRYAGGHAWTAELRGRIHQVLNTLT
jgi:predicted esterase